MNDVEKIPSFFSLSWADMEARPDGVPIPAM
jgi:hypothetical protein